MRERQEWLKQTEGRRLALSRQSPPSVSSLFGIFRLGYAVAQLVGAPSRKVAGLIPDGVTGIFH